MQKYEWPAGRGVSSSRAVLSLAARLVPFHRRGDWHREWTAELWTLAANGSPPARMLRFAAGGVAHALWERRQEEGMMMGGIVRDVRHAVRRLVRTPGFTLVTIAVLALGIGANTALFSALHGALLSTPPYPDTERIVLVDLLLESAAGQPADTMGWSYPKFELGRRELESVESLAGYNASTLTLTGVGPAERLAVEYITPAYFEILGVTPDVGRLLTPDEEAPADAPVVLLSHALWTGRFGGDPGVIGRSLILNDASLEVVGVLEEGFRGLTGSADLWVPVAGITTISGPRRLQRPWAHWLRAVGRLRADVTLAQARLDAHAVGASITEAYPDPDGGGAHDVAIVPFMQARVNPVARTAVTAVSAGALLFLLIACGSVASLLLARAADRRADVAVRAALGASRFRLIWEHVLESMILAGTGGALGLALALGGQSLVATAVRYALDTSGTRGLQYLDPDAMRIGGGTLALGMAVALTTGLLFGLIPAWTASRASPAEDLRMGGAVVGRRQEGEVGRSALVSIQLALTLVLLAGAGLMGSSFARLGGVQTGFTNTDVLTLAYDRGPGVSDAEHHAFVATLLDRLERLPQVVSASAATCAPLAGRCEIVGLSHVDDQPPKDYSEMSGVLAYTASDDYFRTIGVPLLEGRVFGLGDVAGPPVVLINRTAASDLFPGQSAIGHRISITHTLTEGAMATVVGVVGDVRYGSLEETALPAVYLSERQVAMPYGTIFVRTTVDPYEALAGVRRATQEIAPQLPLFDVTTMAERQAAATARTRIVLALLLVFGLSGLAIGAVGLYGIVSHAVSRRTAEVGLRLALGADHAGLVRMMVARPAAVALGSSLVGILVASRLTGYLDQLLFQTSALEPVVLGTSTVLLLTVATAAAWIPARRATRVSPTLALRGD